jgi:flavin reductase (DIM6/NTAB) family NADH-FMN oxidoreductase RutF
MANFDLEELEARRAYGLLARVVLPRPIALVSTLGDDGVGNLAPFSFFNLGGMNPPSVMFCPLNDREGVTKDTVRNIQQTGEYTISLVTRGMADEMNQTSWSYPPGVDEFDQVGFTRAPSIKVAPSRVAESPVSMEVRLHQLVQHGQGPLASNYIIGAVVQLHVADRLLQDGLPDHRQLDLIGRLGGDDYCHVAGDTIFPLSRPAEPK